MGVSDEGENDEHARLVFALGPSASPWTLQPVHSRNAEPSVELAPADEAPLRAETGLHQSTLPSPLQNGLTATSSLPSAQQKASRARLFSAPGTKLSIGDGSTGCATACQPAATAAPQFGSNVGPAAPQMQQRLPTKLSNLKTPVSHLRLQTSPSYEAVPSAREPKKKAAVPFHRTNANLAPPATPIPAKEKGGTGTVLGIPTAPKGKLNVSGWQGRQEKTSLMLSPAPTPKTVASLFNGGGTPARNSRPPLRPAPSSSRSQPVLSAQMPAAQLTQQQNKSPMTMAALGLSTRTATDQQMPSPHTGSQKRVVPFLVSPVSGKQLAREGPDAKTCRAQLLENVTKQVGTSSMFAPKLKRQRNKVTDMLKRLDDAQAVMSQARTEAVALSVAGLAQVPHIQFSVLCTPLIDGDSMKVFCSVVDCHFPHETAGRSSTQSFLPAAELQDAERVEVLKDSSGVYVIVDLDDSNRCIKDAMVGDCFVVLQPWNLLPSSYREHPVLLAFVAVPQPNE